MLNIISRSIISKYTRGPRKVAFNLMRGLDQIGYPYVVNAALDATDMLWIHDDPAALAAAASLPASIAVIAGPNIYTVPREISTSIDISRTLWLSPSLWVKNFWQESGFRHEPHAIWPVGIDTAAFAPTDRGQRDTIVVYVKQRAEKDVRMIIDALDTTKVCYQIIRYGAYQEDEYRSLLARARAMVWLGRSESQGIALLEALAADVPVLVSNIIHFGDWEGPGHGRFTAAELAFPGATAAPYFDAACGMIANNVDETIAILPRFLTTLSAYTPRAYVEAHLSLERQARAMIDLYSDHFGISYEHGFHEKRRGSALWKNASLRYKVLTTGKDLLRNWT